MANIAAWFENERRRSAFHAGYTGVVFEGLQPGVLARFYSAGRAAAVLGRAEKVAFDNSIEYWRAELADRGDADVGEIESGSPDLAVQDAASLDSDVLDVAAVDDADSDDADDDGGDE